MRTAAAGFPPTAPRRTTPPCTVASTVVGRARRAAARQALRIGGWKRFAIRASLLAHDRSALHRLPRRGVGAARPRRAAAAGEAMPGGLSVRAVVADDPAQARALSRA